MEDPGMFKRRATQISFFIFIILTLHQVFCRETVVIENDIIKTDTPYQKDNTNATHEDLETKYTQDTQPQADKIDSKDVVLGIDLGTTYSVVSMFNPKKSLVEIVSFGKSRNTMPSFIQMEVIEDTPPESILNDMIKSEQKYKNSQYFYYKGIWLKKGTRTMVRPVVGWEALEKTKSDKHAVDSYLYRFKPLLARSFNNPQDKTVIQETKHQVKYLLANRVEPSTGKSVVGILINHNGQEIGWTTPRDLSTMILSTLRDNVNKMLGTTDKRKCVVTVPAYFSDEQKRETREAAAFANLNVLEEGIINEPTSAAIAYAYTCAKKQIDKMDDKEFLVFDWGGGTLDISYLTYAEQMLIVKAHTGNNFSGGENINDAIYNYFVSQMVSKGVIKSKDSLDINTTLRLRKTVEDMKIKLCVEQNIIDDSLREKAKKEKKKVSYEGAENNAEQKRKFYIGKDVEEVELVITTEILNDLCSGLFKEIVELIMNKAVAGTEQVDGLMNKIGMSNKDIKRVLYVGGSSRISGVRRLLMDLFVNADHCFDLDADTCVSVGATYFAASHENLIDDDKNIVLVDALPMHVGIRLDNNLFDIMAKAGTQLPNRFTKTFTTTADGQKVVRIEVGQTTTETKKFSNAKNIGKFELQMPENNLAKGQKLIEVTFEIDGGGDIVVTASEMGIKDSNQQQLVITQEDRSMSKEEVDEMNAKYESTREEEEIWIKRCEAGRKLEEYITEMKMKKDQLPDGNKKEEVEVLANETQVWYDRNIKEKDSSLDNSEALESIIKKHEDVKSAFEGLMSDKGDETEKEKVKEEEFIPREDL